MGLYPLLSIDVLYQWLQYPFVAHGSSVPSVGHCR